MYGVDLHPVLVSRQTYYAYRVAKLTIAATHALKFDEIPNYYTLVLQQGEDSVEYFLGLTPSGIILLRNKTKVGNYYWPRINKIYYKVNDLSATLSLIFLKCYAYLSKPRNRFKSTITTRFYFIKKKKESKRLRVAHRLPGQVLHAESK